ncbi:MAG: LysM peptidoglycan-binding domain-containing protein [Lachnospiraceae bacterium]|nr:LysM peptidoglycan-binding domain-containing protein [Lachnospiraceae bacterium]
MGEGEWGEDAVYTHWAAYLGSNSSGSQGGGSANTPSGSAPSNTAKTAESAIIGQIKTAETGSTVTMEGTTTLSNSVMKELLKKGDVSLKLEFTYNEEDYVIVIPAGAALDNDIPWYGPLYLAQQYGNSAGTAAPAAAEAGGVYEVKRGDTLSKIAAANNMTLKQLLAKNPQIKDANKISVGQKINR